MSKHTPGPWTIHATANDLDFAFDVSAGNHTICSVYELPPEDASNARLIAAAPELLWALRRVLPTVEHMYHTNPDPDGSLWADVEACRAALAKAGAA